MLRPQSHFQTTFLTKLRHSVDPVSSQSVNESQSSLQVITPQVIPLDTYFTPVKSSFVTKPCPNSTRSASPASQCTLLSSAASFPISPRCLAHKSVKKSFGIANVPTWGCPTLNLEHKCHRSTFTENRHHATAILTRLPCEYTASATRICCQNQSQASAIHLSEKKWGSKIFKWGYTREGFSLSTTGKGGS